MAHVIYLTGFFFFFIISFQLFIHSICHVKVKYIQV